MGLSTSEIEYSQLQPLKPEDSNALKFWRKMISKLKFFTQPNYYTQV